MTVGITRPIRRPRLCQPKYLGVDRGKRRLRRQPWPLERATKKSRTSGNDGSGQVRPYRVGIAREILASESGDGLDAVPAEIIV